MSRPPVRFETAGLRARELQADEVPAIQAFFDANPGYWLRVNGAPPPPGLAQEEFDERPPPSMSWSGHDFMGLFDHDDRLQGLAVVARDLMQPGVWHLALLTLAEGLQGRGVGTAVYQALEQWMAAHGARWVRLGVVIANLPARRFWARQGFTGLRVASGIDTGGRINQVQTHAKSLAGPLEGDQLVRYLELLPRDRPTPAASTLAPPLARLAAGATIAVIAPAGPTTAERLPRVAPWIEARGWRAQIGPGCHHHEGYLAGLDDARLADLHAALASPEVAAIWCLRGGYGSGRLLPRIDRALVRQARKLLIGYSDITALHALWQLEGLPSLHAPMLTSDMLQDGREADAEALTTLLRDGLRAGTVWQPALAPGALRVPGIVEGPVVGGNLSLVNALLATPAAVPVAGAILFLEDVNEEPYRVDRLLCQLRDAGVLAAAAGFLVGSFTGGDAPDAVLAEYLGGLKKPVLGSWPSGHGTPNRPLPLGLRVRLDAGAGTLTILDDFLV